MGKKPYFTPEYRARVNMNNPDWLEYRRRVFDFWGRECLICGAKQRLEAHHLTYKRLGREWRIDCVPLCHQCHALVEDWKHADGWGKLWAVSHLVKIILFG